MRKTTHFGDLDSDGWPTPHELKQHFFGSEGRYWFPGTRSDSAALWAKDVQGAEHLEIGKGRINIDLWMWRNLDFGVLLIWSRWGGGRRSSFYSKGNLSRLHDFVRASHGDLLPVGLFVPIKEAWKAVKEFIETNGELPKSIEWVAHRDLPPGTFPDP